MRKNLKLRRVSSSRNESSKGSYTLEASLIIILNPSMTQMRMIQRRERKEKRTRRRKERETEVTLMKRKEELKEKVQRVLKRNLLRT